MYAFLDSANAVIALSVTSYTLAEAQAILPGIVTVISDAPQGLIPKGHETAKSQFYHQWASGDGNSIDDYVQVEVLDHLKLAKVSEVDARTEALIAQGLVGSKGQRFRIDTCSMMNYNLMYITRNASGASYPKIIDAFGEDGVEILSNVGAVEQFCTEMFLGRQAIVDSGVALKRQIIEATTKAEIDAIVDNR